ncbi:MAG: rod shape-determining protein MreD [Pseudomonadota bacterium]
MAPSSRERTSVVYIALIFALVLSAVPLPEFLAAHRPDWVALVLLYMAIYTPGHWLMTSALIAGLVMDALFGAPLGQYALALIVACYLPHKLHLRLMLVPIWQATLTALLFLAVYQFVLFWVNGATNNDIGAAFHLWPIVSAIIVWPLTLVILDTARLGRRKKS